MEKLPQELGVEVRPLIDVRLQAHVAEYTRKLLGNEPEFCGGECLQIRCNCRGNLSIEDQKDHDITRLLDAWHKGDVDARDQILHLVYGEMRAMAARQLRKHRAGFTIQPTELVHEVYLKLEKGGDFKDRGHFLALCATAMRHILIDAAKKKYAQKRGGGEVVLSLEEALLPKDSDIERVLAVEEALEHLGEIDRRLVQVVECRFFSGLTEVETANALGVSSRTVNRDWLRARTWLARSLGSSSAEAPEEE